MKKPGPTGRVPWVYRSLVEQGWTPPQQRVNPKVKGSPLTPEWQQLVAYLVELKGRPICGARIKSHGWPCERKPLKNGKCRKHGGHSPPPGPLHPTFRHGRYSMALAGQSIDDVYQKVRTDPQLLQLTEDIAVLVAKQHDTLSKLSTTESKVSFKAAAYWLTRMENAQQSQNKTEEESCRKELRKVLQGGMKDAALWEEYEERAELLRRLVDTERKYQEGLRLYLPIERANYVMMVWMDCIRAVAPPEIIARLHEEFRKRRIQEMPTVGVGEGRDVTAITDGQR